MKERLCYVAQDYQRELQVRGMVTSTWLTVTMLLPCMLACTLARADAALQKCLVRRKTCSVCACPKKTSTIE